MAGSTVEQLQALNASAVLKFHVGGMLFADSDAVCPDPDGLVAADGTITLPNPSDWMSGGRTTTDGITTSRAMSSDDVQSFQSLATVRSDVTQDQISFKTKLQEFNVVNFALRNGLTLAEAQAKFTASGLANKRDTTGRQPLRRCLIVARDTKYNITMVQIVPSMMFSDQGDETVGRATELQLDATFKALADDAYGTDFAVAANGPGWADLSNNVVIPAWQATHAYSLNDEVTNSGAVLKCTTAGTSGSSAPTNPAVGSTVTDGTVVWTRQS